MMITKPTLLKVCPSSLKVSDIVVSNFNALSCQYEVTTPERVAAFISQVAHESSCFLATLEYASGAAYEGRKDLGNIFKGDGIKFKGRGYIQITGRNNYKEVSNAIFGDDRLLNTPEILQTPLNAMTSALYFWKSRGLNKLADMQYYQTITMRINGGLNGFKERIDLYNILCKEFGLHQYSFITRDIIP